MNTEQLYELLPAIYRIRDTEQGEPLKALLGVIAEQISVLEEDLSQLYDDQFIETCAEWVVPYIGDLIGTRSMYNITAESLSSRAEVANTMGYRRRKGTAAMLEQFARDVTGWNARVVEFFQLLATTQFMNHIRPHNYYAPDLRRWQQIDNINTAFEQVAHTVDVRRIASGRGRYNIPNIGIFLWRLQAYPLERITVPQVAPGQYSFNPLGFDAPLFNSPQTETELTTLAEEINVPHFLKRRPLYEELEARRQALAEGKTSQPLYFNSDAPVLRIFLNNQPEVLTPETIPEIPPEEILICNLSDWRKPPASKPYQPKNSESVQDLPIQVAVDPVLGRLTFPEGIEPTQVEVSYAYGFSHDMGGGSYNRSQSVFSFLPPEVEVNWQRGVTKNASESDDNLVQTLTQAVTEWNNLPPGTVGIITILDSRTYTENLSINIPEGSQLMIVAADWPLTTVSDASEETQRIIGQLSPQGIRPHLQGNLDITGTNYSDNQPGRLALDGVLIEGTVTVLDGNLGYLRIAHSTLVPSRGELRVESNNKELNVEIDNSICAEIILAETIPKLTISNSIIEKSGLNAITALGATTNIVNSTILGSTTVYILEASNSIFMEDVIATRRQIGCVRFSYLPLTSQVPRRYRCQPETEEDSTRVRPQFTSLRYGDPGYCQLSQRSAIEIRQGADDEAEMGAFHNLYQPQRETNLKVRLQEYLRFGLEAGIIYVT